MNKPLFGSLISIGNLITAAAVLGIATGANARVTRIAVERIESPTFAGTAYGSVGAYEKIVGRYFGELDPGAERTAIIVDLDKAPRNANGRVEYSADFYILKPLDLTKGNRTVFYEFGNRGNKSLVTNYNSASTGGNNPTTVQDAGNGFLMRGGYTLVWSGLLGDVQPGGDRLTIQLPIARNSDGSVIEGTDWEECNFFNNTTQVCNLFYPVPRLDQAEATLLVRERRSESPVEVPRDQWTFAGPGAIRLLPLGTPFKAGHIYQFIHKAANPPVMGIGFAAVRDWLTFLKLQAQDDFGNANPLAGSVQTILSFGASQTGRVSREFLYLGFNEDESQPGRRVIDGMDIHISATRPMVNYRFAVPTRVADLQHEGLFYPTSEFPFAYEDQTDPLTGRTDGILHRCTAVGNCPKVMHTTTSLEYWVFKNSTVITDPLGTRDAQFPENVRAYLFSGAQHLADRAIVPAGVCEQPPNIMDYRPLLRSLLVGLRNWVTTGAPPPASRVPRIADATLVKPENVNWPAIPDVTFAGPVVNRHRIYDYGPAFDEGIITQVLPIVTGLEYQILVPQVDADGNDIAGIRLPTISVPVATRTGWAVRANFGAVGELCNQDGSLIPFAATAAQRLATGDPRLSVKERYPNHAIYVNRVVRAVNDLVRQRYLLSEDGIRIINEANQSDIGR